MKILLLGDIHEDIGKAVEIVNSVACDFVLQVGDMGVYHNYSKPVYFIAGNHENWETLDSIDKGAVKFKNLYHIKTAEIVKLTKGGETLNLSGINGNYSPKSYGTKIQGKRRHFTKDSVERCKKLKEIDIFLTHEAPSDTGLVKRGGDVGVGPIKEILETTKPRFLVFGHHHTFFEKETGTTKIIGLDRTKRSYCILDTANHSIQKQILS